MENLMNLLSKMSGDILRPVFSGYHSNQPKDYFSSRTTVEAKQFGVDVVDNNTYRETDLTQTAFKPLYVMNDRFHREDERLKTFDSWPLDWLNKKELAMSGMFYMGVDDKTKCYFCEVEIGRWEPEDQPVPEHMRWSPNCPLLRRRTTNNVPINCEELNRLLPPPSYDICGLNEHIEVRPNAFTEGIISEDEIPSASLASSSGYSSSSSGTTYYPEYPEYAIETARLRTFNEWPRNMKQKPAQLAEAGFFYTGVGDRVKCFSCGGGLKDWDDNDEPWEQHALWMGKCRYVKLVKGDNYIEMVVNRFKKSSEEGESLNTTTTPPPSPSTATTLNNAAVTKETIPAQTTNTANQAVIENLTSTGTTSSCGAAVVELEQNGKKSCSTTIPEEKLCKICYANEYNTAFLPCGHVVACAKCASSVTKCPMCRKPFANVMRVYFS